MLAIVTSHPIQYQAPLWRALAKAGVKFEVWFLTPHAVQRSFDREFGQSFAWDIDLLAGYPHRFLEIEDGWVLNRFNGIRLRRSWREEFATHGISHVWVEGWRFAELWRAVRAAHTAGLSVWLRGENHDLAPESFWRQLWKRPLLNWLFQRVDHFLCIGSANERFYQRHGVPAKKLHRAPYCVDNEFFATRAQALRPTRSEIRRAWQIPDEAFCLLFCGKLIAKKRPMDLVAAAKLAGPMVGRPWHLLFAGDGELAAPLQTALIAPVSPRGTFTGFLNQSRIPEALVAADCLVLPSDYGETWGLVVNEALASGLPAIVSDHCGCAEDLAAPLGPAHVFPCGNVRSLADCLHAVASNSPAAEVIHALSEAHSPRRTVETVQAILNGTSPQPLP